jgi:hypothetical protein
LRRQLHHAAASDRAGCLLWELLLGPAADASLVMTFWCGQAEGRLLGCSGSSVRQSLPCSPRQPDEPSQSLPTAQGGAAEPLPSC